MGSRLAELAARREEQVARSHALRAEFRENAERVSARFSWVDRVVSAGRAMRRSGPILAAVGAAAVIFVGPSRVFRFLTSAYRYAPMALGAFQFARRAAGPPDKR